MSTTSQVTTFSDLYGDLMSRTRQNNSAGSTQDQAKRYINIALQDMHIGFGEKFYWAERSAILRTRATYSTGTVTVTKGSTTVTGSSTLWNTNDDFGVTNAQVGGKIVFAGGNDVYEVLTVASDTSITLTTAYIDTTAAGASYVYYEDDYALDADFLRPLDYQRFSSPANIDLIPRSDFRRLFIRNKTTGRPHVATLITKDPSGDVNLLRRVRLHRAPDSEYLIPYAFVTNKLAVSSTGTLATELSADTDEPIVPLQYRHAIVLHALYHWYRDKKDDQRSTEAKGEYIEILSRVVGDTEFASPKPRMKPRMGPYKRRAKRPYDGSTTSRYVTGSRFDEIR